MAITNYTFNKGSVNVPQLQREIIDAALPTPNGVTFPVDISGDNLLVQFDPALTAPQVTTLTTTVTNHVASSNSIAPTVTPQFYIHGGAVERLTNNQVGLGTAGQDSTARDSTNVFDIDWNGQIVGVMPADLDTGAETADTWYAVHVIGDELGINAVKVLFSLSGTAPTLPTGYTSFRRMGWARNDSGLAFLSFFESGMGTSRTIIYNEPLANITVLSAQSATAFATVACGTLVPAIGRAEVFFLLEFDNSGAGGQPSHDLRMRPGDSTVTNTGFRLQPGVDLAAPMQMNTFMFTDASQQIQYQVSQNNNLASIYVLGYRDEL